MENHVRRVSRLGIPRQFDHRSVYRSYRKSVHVPTKSLPSKNPVGRRYCQLSNDRTETTKGETQMTP